MKKILFTTDDNKIIDRIWIDGYLFGERQLEGCTFGISFDINGKADVITDKRTLEYFKLSRISKRKIFNDAIESARSYIEDNDWDMVHSSTNLNNDVSGFAPGNNFTKNTLNL